MTRNYLAGNRAIGGFGSSGGNAEGSGLWVFGIATIVDSMITGNRASAGPAGIGAGGGILVTPGTTLRD